MSDPGFWGLLGLKDLSKSYIEELTDYEI